MEGLVQHPTIIISIISYLNVVEYVALRRALPSLVTARGGKLYPTPAEVLVKVVEKKLKSFCIDKPYDHVKIMNNLSDGFVYLTGGFLLSCLSGCESKDIDLLAVLNEGTQFRDTAEYNIVGFHNTAVSHHEHPPRLPIETTYLPYLKSTRCEGYMYLAEFDVYISKPGSIDFIYHKNINDMLRHVTNFDFAFCRNIFDMKRKRLKIFDLESIIEGKCTLSMKREYDHFLRLVNPITNITTISEFIEQIRSPRIRKYRERGFDIVFDFKYVMDENFVKKWKKAFN